jgi:xanthine dehydrogenase large subunit
MNQSVPPSILGTTGAAGVVPTGAVGVATRHESAHLHVAGAATYTDDIPEVRGTLHAAFGLSTRAHARIVAMDLDAVRNAPGVVAVIVAGDIPGENNFGPVVKDDPILADGVVHYVGQPVFLVVAETVDAARRAARSARIEYADLPAILTIEDALAAQSFVMPSVTLERGDAARALAEAPHRLRGTFRLGGQEQFYLEGHVAYAVPKEDGMLHVHSSNQYPAEAQYKIAHALGLPVTSVVVECRRMGGGFGGKESQASLPACAAALAAARLKRPVKLRLDRDDDMTITGKRHDFRVDWDVGFDATGRILGLDLMLASRCGYSTDLSQSVNDRAMTHADNAYFLENVRIVSHRLRTNTQSATAFRGFGGPQGMLAGETVIDEIARFLGRDAHEIRKRNLYGPGRDVTHYGQTIEDFVLPELYAEIERTSDYAARRAAIAAWNRTSPVVKRGIAMTPIKFGIAFTATFMNQGAAMVHVYQDDGSVFVNHGGTEMGQGLHTKVAQVVAEEFGIDVARVRSSATETSRIPNGLPTAASSGSDINGKAAQAAAAEIRGRMTAFAASHFGVPESAVRFAGGEVHAGTGRMTFAALAKLCFMHRVQLWASGYYRTPKVGYDPVTLKGRPFLYYAYGVACTEAAIDTLTGESRILRVDVLHDVGRSLNPAIDLGQVEGGYVQGLGWLTSEELWWDAAGRLRTHAPSTYKIPVASDVPAAWHVKLWERGENVEDTIHRSKAVGEPPLMLALSAFFAIKDAVAASADHRASPPLDAPATPEAILNAVDALRARLDVRAQAADGG